MVSMWVAVYGGLEGPSTDKTTRKPTKNEFLLVKREKNMKIHTSDMTKYFFSKALLMNIYMTHHNYMISLRRKCV